jgi:hypothetical protein
LGLKLNEHNIDFISNILKTVSLLILWCAHCRPEE